MEASEGKRSALVSVAGCGCIGMLCLFGLAAISGISAPFMGSSYSSPPPAMPNAGVPLAQPSTPSILSPPAPTMPTVPGGAELLNGALTLWDGEATSLVFDGPARSACQVRITRHERVSLPWCRAHVECDGQVLRGDGNAGYFECTFGTAFPAGEDDDHSDVDSAFSLDESGHFTIADRARNGRPAYRMEGELGPWRATTMTQEVVDAEGDFASFSESELSSIDFSSCNGVHAMGAAQLEVRRGADAAPASVRRVSCVGLMASSCECLERELGRVVEGYPTEVGVFRVNVSFARD